MFDNRITISIVLAASLVSAAAGPQPPKPRALSEIEAVLAKAPKPSAEKLRRLNIVLMADKKDHGVGEHDYPLWQKRWALMLGGNTASQEERVNFVGPAAGSSGAAEVNVTTAWNWPSDEQFETADVIVAYCYMDWKPGRMQQVEDYLNRGGGLVVMHPASWTQPQPSARVAGMFGIGGYRFYRHGPVRLKIAAKDDPICLGLPQTIEFEDETYWPPTPFDANQTVVLATCDEEVSRDSNEMAPQPIFWTHQSGKGRVFGCLPGHFMWTFDDPYFRILLLRGIAWAAGESPYRFDSLVLEGAMVTKEN